MGRQLVDHPAPRLPRLRHQGRIFARIKAQVPTPVPHRCSVPTEIAPEVIKACRGRLEALYFELDSDLAFSTSSEHAIGRRYLARFPGAGLVAPAERSRCVSGAAPAGRPGLCCCFSLLLAVKRAAGGAVFSAETPALPDDRDGGETATTFAVFLSLTRITRSDAPNEITIVTLNGT